MESNRHTRVGNVHFAQFGREPVPTFEYENTLAEARRLVEWQKSDEALAAFSLAIIQSEDDIIAQASVYAERAEVYRKIGDYQQACNDLVNARNRLLVDAVDSPEIEGLLTVVEARMEEVISEEAVYSAQHGESKSSSESSDSAS